MKNYSISVITAMNTATVFILNVRCNVKNITKTRALKELKETKELFKKMINTSNDLREFIEGREIEYVLSYNYGMGSLEICSEKNGIIKWTNDVNDN